MCSFFLFLAPAGRGGGRALTPSLLFNFNQNKGGGNGRQTIYGTTQENQTHLTKYNGHSSFTSTT